MYYKPHLLQVLRHYVERDNYGRITVDEDRWEDVCPCRCDNNNTKRFKNANGETYTPKYHIVAEGYAEIEAGEQVRAIIQDTNVEGSNNSFAFTFGEQSFGEESSDGKVRGIGVVYNVHHLNYLKYTEVWV